MGNKKRKIGLACPGAPPIQFPTAHHRGGGSHLCAILGLMSWGRRWVCLSGPKFKTRVSTASLLRAAW